PRSTAANAPQGGGLHGTPRGDSRASRNIPYGVPACSAYSPRPPAAERSARNRARGRSLTSNASRLVATIASPRAGSCEPPPQFTPPPNPGNAPPPSRLGGVKLPPERRRAMRVRHASRASGEIPQASLAVRREGARGRGRKGNGCVRQAPSPATVLRGTARSSTGNSGTPVSR